jgi:hypothetical protein
VINIEETTLSSLRHILFRDYKFRAELRHVAIFGLCEICRQKPSAEKS